MCFSAYHGHTIAEINISPYKFDHTGGDGKADWVHVVRIGPQYAYLHEHVDIHTNMHACARPHTVYIHIHLN